jgi:hypothetical protein
MTAADFRTSEFFEMFAEAGALPELDLLGDCFADPLLAAGPRGAQVVAKEVFLQALPRRAKAFADAGVGPAALTSLDAQRLDEHYLLARTGWDAPRLDGGEPVHLEATFLLHDDGDRLRIVLYLNHQGL